MVRKAVKDEADKLIHDFGREAYRNISQRLSAARRRRHERMELFLGQVAQEIERRLKKMPPNLKPSRDGTSSRSTK
jgi:hypothetical protein